MSKQKMNIGINQTPHKAPKSQNNNKKVVLGILCTAAVLVSALQVVTHLTQQNMEAENSFIAPQSINAANAATTQQMGDDFYKAASGNAAPPAAPKKAQAAQTTQPQAKTPAPAAQPKPAAKAQPKDDLVTVNLSTNVGRVHPFVPAVSLGSYSAKMPKVPAAYYPAPPTQIIPNEPAIKLMETTISGIMYDALSPSAIISVEGQDHLVRKGDRINGYKIVNITKDRVIVQNGTNVYRATVGETLTTENTDITFNKVYNLQQKFGGSNAPKGTKMIQIN